jgi:hypothetical protein
MRVPTFVVRGLAAAGIAAAFVPSAEAQVLTFSGNACAGNGLATGPGPYVEAGYQLAFDPNAANAWAYWCAGSNNYPGSPAIFSNTASGLVTLTKVGGGVFSLNSIDLATAAWGASSGYAVFTGFQTGGGAPLSVNFWQAATGHPAFTTDTFSGWDNLIRVDLAQSGPLFQFDNIVLNGGNPVAPDEEIAPATTVTPEPGTMALLATGLVGLTIAGWRRRRTA